LRYANTFGVLSGNPSNDASPLQLPSVHHYPYYDQRACDTEEKKENI